MNTATIGAQGRGLWRFSAWTTGVLFDGPIELEARGNLRDWMVMSEGERIDALSTFWSSGLRRQREMVGGGPPPSRQARTSLGFGLLGSWAPRPVRTGEFRLALPDGSELDVHGEAATDGEWILYLPGGPTARMSNAPRST